LQGTGQTPVVSLAPNQTASIPVEVTNTNALSATQITLYQDYYAAALGDSWRWAVHQPNPFGNPGVVSLTPPLPSGASRTVTFNLTAPASAGIYRLGYFMGANTAAGFLWNRSGTMPGVYYQVLSTPVSTDLFRFRLTVDQPAYDFGQTATLTASLFNDRAVARTFTLEARSGLAAAPVQVVVGPHSTATETYTTVVDRTRQVRIAALENANTVSELLTTVRLKLPTLGLSGTPEEMLAGVAANGAFTATVSNVPVGTTTVDWEVRQNGALLQSTSTPLVGTVGNSVAELAASLPAAPPDTEFTVRVALPNTSRAMTMTIPVLRPVEVRSIFLTDGPVIDDQNADLLLVSLQDPGYPGQYAVQALLKDGSAVLTSSPVVTGASGGSLSYETLDLPLPASLTLGITPTVAISLTGQFDGATDTYSDTFELPLPLAAPQVSLSSATRRAGQPLDITVEALPDNVELPADSPFDVALIGLSTYGYYYLPVESFTPTARGAVLHTHIPPYLYSGGLYDVQVTSWQLGGWESHSNLSVPPHQIDLDAPAAIDAGDTLTATIQNSGGVTATVSGSLVLVDRRKLAVCRVLVLPGRAGRRQPTAGPDGAGATAQRRLHAAIAGLRPGVARRLRAPVGDRQRPGRRGRQPHRPAGLPGQRPGFDHQRCHHQQHHLRRVAAAAGAGNTTAGRRLGRLAGPAGRRRPQQLRLPDGRRPLRADLECSAADQRRAAGVRRQGHSAGGKLRPSPGPGCGQPGRQHDLAVARPAQLSRRAGSQHQPRLRPHRLLLPAGA
ncbi:MAG: hypothetical protein M9927_18880, partial [Anaerolineae bacterium]|nr:hypothetical protein [Anaerolineae bacterium]